MAVRAVRSSRPLQKVETHDATAHVMSSGVGIDEDKRRVIEVRKFETEPAWVRVNAGVTKNLGNYESLRVDVAITVPCYVEEIPAVQKKTAAMVADMLDEEVALYVGNDNQAGG